MPRERELLLAAVECRGDDKCRAHWLVTPMHGAPISVRVEIPAKDVPGKNYSEKELMLTDMLNSSVAIIE